MSEHMKRDWQEKANAMRMEPSSRVWERLEKRLDQDRGKVRISVLKRWTAIAATMAILLTSVALIWQFKGYHEQQITFLEELEDSAPTPSFAVYRQAGDINAAYARGSWKQINEGSKEQLETGQPLQTKMMVKDRKEVAH